MNLRYILLIHKIMLNSFIGREQMLNVGFVYSFNSSDNYIIRNRYCISKQSVKEIRFFLYSCIKMPSFFLKLGSILQIIYSGGARNI